MHICIFHILCYLCIWECIIRQSLPHFLESWKWSAVLRFCIFAASSVPVPHKPWWHYLIAHFKTFHAGNSCWKKIFPLTWQHLLPPFVMKPKNHHNITAALLIQLVTVSGNNRPTFRNSLNHQSVVAVYDRSSGLWLGCWSLPTQDDQDQLSSQFWWCPSLLLQLGMC